MAARDVKATEHVGAALAQLSEGPSAGRVAAHLVQHSGAAGLALLRRACETFKTEVTVQRVLIVVIAGVAVSPPVKLALVEARLLDCIILAMNRFKNHALLQEQGCRGVTAVSKGVEEIKSKSTEINHPNRTFNKQPPFGGSGCTQASVPEREAKC